MATNNVNLASKVKHNTFDWIETSLPRCQNETLLIKVTVILAFQPMNVRFTILKNVAHSSLVESHIGQVGCIFSRSYSLLWLDGKSQTRDHLSELGHRFEGMRITTHDES